MKILLLYNNDNAMFLYKKLCALGEEVVLYSESLKLDVVKQIKPEYIISYNYNYIVNEDIIEFMNEKIVNLHTSYLPWNRGQHPNLWSFIENTPNGVTIHKLSARLDRGQILLQKEMFFDAKNETFASSYRKLNDEIVDLFINNWEKIKTGEIVSKEQIGDGSYHRTKDYLELKDKIDFTWDDNIYEFMQRYNKMIKEGE